jgi:hypothetical protein
MYITMTNGFVAPFIYVDERLRIRRLAGAGGRVCGKRRAIRQSGANHDRDASQDALQKITVPPESASQWLL